MLDIRGAHCGRRVASVQRDVMARAVGDDDDHPSTSSTDDLPVSRYGASSVTESADWTPDREREEHLFLRATTTVTDERGDRRTANDIASAVKTNAVTVVIGETGSGKTTQIAQILLRSGVVADGSAVAVTQPRRVAAVSVAKRVAEEMGVEIGKEVGYSVRFEDRTCRLTRIKYLTDGTLLRELLEDPTLSRYSVVVLDEAHERSLHTDILFGLLKKLVSARELKLVITSATLDSEKFSTYFDDAPVFTVPGRTFPVQIAHATEAPKSYFQSAIETVVDVHVNTGPGDMLVFLTGQEEIEKACRAVEAHVRSMPEGECPDVQVLPLYASLPPDMQSRVFHPHDPNVRRIIFATNIAETSLTVPGIVFVIDPGVVKQVEYDAMTGMNALKVVPISSVQAKQRAGRAGRTQAGRCYRLYTKDALELDMPAITRPEIQRTCLVGTILYLKTLNLKGLDVMTFDFLDPPDTALIADALRQLYFVGAIDLDGKATSIGREMSSLPLEPCLSRAMVEAKRLDCVADTATVAAMLSVERVFLGQHRDATESLHELATHEDFLLGDHVVLLRIYQAWESSGYQRKFHQRYSLSDRGMEFAREIRKQLLGVFKDKRKSDRNDFDCFSRTDEGLNRLRQSLCAGFVTKIAHRLPNHNGYRTLGENSTLCQVHPSMARQLADKDGLLPEWIVYHELITTSRPFLRHVCKIEPEWISKQRELLSKKVNIHRLSGGVLSPEDAESTDTASGHEADTVDANKAPVEGRRITDEQVSAARERFLARKKQKLAKLAGK
jgi:ATP-dependent RNA helicase DHX8/PRP22